MTLVIWTAAVQAGESSAASPEAMPVDAGSEGTLEFAPRPLASAHERAKAHRLRVAGQAVTGVGLGAMAGVLTAIAVVEVRCGGGACFDVLYPVMGVPVAASLAVAGGAMWGVGAKRERALVAVAPTPYLMDEGAGLAVVGRW